jgi:hypothetical protein
VLEAVTFFYYGNVNVAFVVISPVEIGGLVQNHIVTYRVHIN